MAVSPDGERIATIDWQFHEVDRRIHWRHTLQLWTKGGDQLASFPGGEGVWGVEEEFPTLEFSPDGKLLAFGANNQVRLIDVFAQRKLSQHLDVGGSVRALAFSPMENRIAIGSHDRKITLWDVDARSPVQLWTAHGDAVTSLAFATSRER